MEERPEYTDEELAEMAEKEKLEKEEASEDKPEFPIVIVLKEPVKYGKNGLLTDITISAKPTVNDFDGLPSGELRINDLRKLIRRLSGQPDIAIGNICMEDFGEIMVVIKRFL